jgi:segregation and condensation protein B
MDENATKVVIEAALLVAGRPLPFDRIVEIFSRKGVDVDRGEIRAAIESLAADYASRGIELREVASGFRIQARSSMRDWLDPLFEERAPRYTRALLETLALVAYRQPITRAEIEEVRGVAVSSNIIRTLIERSWVRVVGHRDVPGKPSMLGTTREFLDYFGLRRLEDLPPLSELRDLEPGSNLQSDFLDRLAEGAALAAEAGAPESIVETAEQTEEPEQAERVEEPEQAERVEETEQSEPKGQAGEAVGEVPAAAGPETADVDSMQSPPVHESDNDDAIDSTSDDAADSAGFGVRHAES